MDKINVAVIGCGGFARGMHLPNLRKNSSYRIYAVVDIDESLAKKVAQEYGAIYFTSYDKVLEDNKVNLVLITTRHNLHSEMTIKAARAHKHILCEKPMGLNYKECKEVIAAVKNNGVKYTIGYNRGLAPLVTKAFALLKDNPYPKVIYHRMQNFSPYGAHWLHDEKIGGGRVIGEGCHVLDLACVLTGTRPIRIYAEGGILSCPGKEGVPDSSVITIGFDDGSIAALLLSSVGHGGIAKEVTEVYCHKTAIIVDNFQSFRAYGFGDPIEEKLAEGDKGHQIELHLLAEAILKDEESPNDLASALRAALLSFKVNEAIKTGKVQYINPKELEV